VFETVLAVSVPAGSLPSPEMLDSSAHASSVTVASAASTAERVDDIERAVTAMLGWRIAARRPGSP
jgi:hypothetical protein